MKCKFSWTVPLSLYIFSCLLRRMRVLLTWTSPCPARRPRRPPPLRKLIKYNRRRSAGIIQPFRILLGEKKENGKQYHLFLEYWGCWEEYQLGKKGKGKEISGNKNKILKNWGWGRILSYIRNFIHPWIFVFDGWRVGVGGPQEVDDREPEACGQEGAGSQEGSRGIQSY